MLLDYKSVEFASFFSSFRTRNHRLEVETGRWTGIKYDERNLCKAETGDEYHYLLTCKHLDNIRKSHIKPKYFKWPNIIKYGNLINANNKAILTLLAKFIKVIYKTVKNS